MNEYITNAFTRQGEQTNLEINNLNVDCITSRNNKFELDSEGNLSVKSITAEEGLPAQQEIDILNSVYPVGSIYLSTSSTSPTTLFGGVWQQITNRFLLCCGSSYANGTTGGASTVALTTQNLPAHTHAVTGTTAGAGSHNHTSGTKEMSIKNGSLGTWSGLRPEGYSSDATVTGTNTVANHTHSINFQSGSVGSGTAHNNMPPYLAVYAWKRTQ